MHAKFEEDLIDGCCSMALQRRPNLPWGVPKRGGGGAKAAKCLMNFHFIIGLLFRLNITKYQFHIRWRKHRCRLFESNEFLSLWNIFRALLKMLKRRLLIGPLRASFQSSRASFSPFRLCFQVYFPQVYNNIAYFFAYLIWIRPNVYKQPKHAVSFWKLGFQRARNAKKAVFLVWALRFHIRINFT